MRPVWDSSRKSIWDFPATRGVSVTSTATAYPACKPGDEGVLFTSGDNTGGYALYIQDGKLKFHCNWLAFKHFHVESDAVLPEGELELAFDFCLARAGAGIGRLLINGSPGG